MFKFFDFIVGILRLIFVFIATFFDSVIAFIEHVVNGIQFVYAVVLSLPPFCQGALCVILAISIASMFISSVIKIA